MAEGYKNQALKMLYNRTTFSWRKATDIRHLKYYITGLQFRSGRLQKSGIENTI